MTLQRREIDIGIGDETSSVPFFSDIEWSRNNVVIVSEQSAPEDWKVIWEQNVSRSIKAVDKSVATEKLFIIKD